LQGDGLLVFTYHHSRDDGWQSVAEAILNSGFTVVNAHPVKSAMSVATPKSQASEPIQLDEVMVCRKGSQAKLGKGAPEGALKSAQEKLRRLEAAGFLLSKNDKRVVTYGQLLSCIETPQDVA
jgi:putative DNA methylase